MVNFVHERGKGLLVALAIGKNKTEHYRCDDGIELVSCDEVLGYKSG